MHQEMRQPWNKKELHIENALVDSVFQKNQTF